MTECCCRGRGEGANTTIVVVAAAAVAVVVRELPILPWIFMNIRIIVVAVVVGRTGSPRIMVTPPVTPGLLLGLLIPAVVPVVVFGISVIV